MRALQFLSRFSPGFRPAADFGAARSLFRIAIATVAFSVTTAPALADYVPLGGVLSSSSSFGTNWEIVLSGDGATTAFSAGFVGAVYVRNGSAWDAGGSLPKTGSSADVSADGGTVIVGGASPAGAFVMVRSGGDWVQQGDALIGSGGTSSQPTVTSVAIAADGNTAAIGVSDDAATIGAIWIFKRSNGVWMQDGPKLVPAGAGANDLVGRSLAMSADGSTVAVGGNGGVWVFTRDATQWAQQGGKLTGLSGIGREIALSGDGNTLAAGGPNGYSTFVRIGASWGAAGDIAGTYAQSDAALSASGGTLVIGGSSSVWGGEALVYKRSGPGWAVTAGPFSVPGRGSASYCCRVGISDNARTFVVGAAELIGPRFWGFAQAYAESTPEAVHDFSADGKSDVLWRHTSGQPYLWLMNGVSYTGSALDNVDPSWTIVGQRDFNGDGKADILWRSGSRVVLWLMDGRTQIGFRDLGSVPGWSVAGLGDFNGDGQADILWRNGGGDLAIWFMSNGNVSSIANLGNVPTNWTVAAVGNFNSANNAKTDIVWRENAGWVAIWYMDGAVAYPTPVLGGMQPNWSIVGIGDFNGDRSGDILWRETGGAVIAWARTDFLTFNMLYYGSPSPAWAVAQTGDYNGDGVSDILWRHSDGGLALWQMSSSGVGSTFALGAVGTDWQVQSINAN